MVLTKRDIDILLMIYNYDRVGSKQLCDAFFASASNCYLRMRKLRKGGYIQARRLNATVPMGSGIYLYGLGPLGRKALGEILELSVPELRKLNGIKDPIFVDHHLGICDFRLALEQSCRAYGVQLENWTSERELREAKWRPEPDGVFTLMYKNECKFYRLEYDRGTAAKPKMLLKLGAYVKDKKMRWRVLWVVPDAKRLKFLKEWGFALCKKEGVNPELFWYMVKDQDPLAPVWVSPTKGEHQSLLGGFG